MLMTDFNQSKPLTDWHFLGSDTHRQQHSMQAVSSSRPAAAPKAVPFVEGMSLVKGGLAQVQQPAKPFAGLAQVQQQRQNPQHTPAQQQKHTQRTQQRGSAVGIASVSGADSTSSSSSSNSGGSSSSSGLSAGLQAPEVSAGSSGPHAGADAPSSGGLLGFKPESMVALLKTALQRNMRMSAPNTKPAEQTDSSSSSGSSSSSSSVGGGDWGGISTVTMEAVQMWCIACQEPAYLLATAGYCGKCCCCASNRQAVAAQQGLPLTAK
jgi:hypothetical protein